MGIFPNSIYNAVKSALEGSSHLSYVDKIVIQKFRLGNLPTFDHHCIIISPSFIQAVTYGVAQKYFENSMHLHLLVVMTTYGEEDAIIADEPTATPPNVGILPMFEDVFTTLFENNLGGEVNLIPGMAEFDQPSFFEVVTEEEQEGFLMTARLEYRPKGVRFLSPL